MHIQGTIPSIEGKTEVLPSSDSEGKLTAMERGSYYSFNATMTTDK